jgi:hypothetical protein
VYFSITVSYKVLLMIACCYIAYKVCKFTINEIFIET